MRRCKSCGRYTLRKDRCPYCGGELEVPHPAKFSPEDRYGKYRLYMRVISGELKLSPDVAKLIIEKLSQRGS